MTTPSSSLKGYSSESFQNSILCLLPSQMLFLFFLNSLTNSTLHKLCAIRVRMYSANDDVRKNQKHHQASKDVQYKQVNHQGLVQEDTSWRYFPMNKSLLSLIYKAKIVNPSYSKLFRTHTLYQGGGGGSSGPPIISSAIGCINLKFCKVLEITFKVSGNTRFVKKSFVWLPWQLFDNMVLFANNCQNKYEKQVFFKCCQKPQIKRC